MDSNIPAIQTFQFEAEGIGDLSKSVNLFRGDVNLSQTILNLPDRPGRSDLAVALSILYKSNVYDTVSVHNLEAPTGVLGVGWELSLDRIFVDSQGTASPATWIYYLQSGETIIQLVRQSAAYQQPYFTTTAITQSDLNSSQISSNLQQVFAAHGIALSQSGSVSTNSDGTWTITDMGNEQSFTLAVNGATTTISNGGESYQLQNYQFWQITYYPSFERWIIVRENGLCSSYGGGVQTTSQGYQTSQGNSVQWSVRWGNWLGNSSVTQGQQQYATAWYLYQISNSWGDAVQYRYNGWERDAATGLLPDVEQLVGAEQTDGKPFTKAVYLTQITDVFSRTINLNYADKVYNDPTTNPTAPREYQDLHKPIANNTNPNSFQDLVETNYLDNITVYSSAGNLLFTIQFAYMSELVNVTENTGVLYGDTCKRYLQSVTQYTAMGDFQPGFVFDYYTEPDNINAGALQSITYPTGAVATYTYSEKSLAICARQQTVAAPDTSGNWIPQVFFGSDYTVTLWYNNVAGQLSMTVYTWIGRWQSWQPDGRLIYNNTLGLEIENIEVLLSDEHFVVSFPAFTSGSEQSTFAYIYHKDPQQMGQWIPLDNGGTSAITFDTNGATASLAVGSTFVVAVQFQDSNNSYTVSSYTWDWSIRNWRTQTAVASGTASGVAIATGQEYYLLLAYTLHQAQAQVQIFWVDPLGNWHQGNPLTDNLTVSYTNELYLTADKSMVAVGCLSQQSPTYPQYMLAIYQWDENYTLSKTFSQTFKQQVRQGGAAAVIAPQVMNNSLVLCGENVVRYNGAVWQLNQELQIQNPPVASQDAWYAVGEDFVVQTIPSVSVYMTPSCKLLEYDPDTDGTGWGNKTLLQPQPPLQYRQNNPNTAGFPTTSDGGYFTSDKNLYARGQTPDWSSGVQQPLFSMPNNLDTKAVVNESPYFIAYEVPNQDPTQTVTQVLILKNGEVVSTETLTAEKYWTTDEKTSPNGRYPAGQAAFVTYAATLNLFDQAQSYNLYRFAGDSITENLIHYPVAAIAVTDGFGQSQCTAYDFDPSSAACDSSGKVVKYYKSTTYNGCTDPSNSQYGYTETYYINSYQGTTPYFYVLDGMIEQILTYDSENNLVASEQQTWTVYTACNSNPLVADETPLALNGTYTKLTAQVTLKDGVTTTITHNFVPTGFDAPYSGQELETATTIYSTSTLPETHCKTQQYGYEIYPDFIGQNLLSAVVQTIQSVSVNGADPVAVEAQVATYKLWDTATEIAIQVLDISEQYTWQGGTSVAFPFDSTPDPTVWLCKATIVARTSRGLVTEVADALSIPKSLLYDSNQEFLIATFGNTSLSGNEGTYCGFEPYMNLQGWTVQGNAASLAGDAHTGEYSLQLPANGAGSLSTTLTPTRQSQSYILGWWYKTDANFQNNSQTGWTITVTAAGKPVGNMIFAPFTAQETWTYGCQVIELDSYQSLQPTGTLSITLTASNTTTTPVLLDDLSVSPFPATVVANTYNTDHAQLLTETYLGSNIQRHIYDRFQRKLGTIGLAEQVTSLTTQYASRKGNNDQFNSLDPNCLIGVHARSGGTCDQFQTGNEWQARWTPTGNWQTTRGTLTNTGNAALTIATTEFCSNFALLFNLTAPNPISDTLGINLGENSALTWVASTNQWNLSIAGQSVAPLVQSTSVACQWLLISSNNSLLFYADGQLLFSLVDQSLSIASVQFFTGNNSISLSILTWVQDPMVGVEFRDAAGRKRQAQVLLENDSLVSQMIYDEAGKQVAATKPTPGSFGQGANEPLFTYRSTLVDVADFLANLDNNGIMQGDVADYYQGQTESASGLPRSNDEGYPYTRIRYEASPLGRKIERGLPGKDQAIIETVPLEQRNTEQFQYSGGSTGVIPNQQDGNTDQYFVEVQIKPPNNASNQPLSQQVVKDKTNQVVVSATSITSGVDQALVTTSTASYSDSGTQTEICLPNYYSKQGSNQQQFVTVSSRNPLGQIVCNSDPDTQLNQAIYDSAGKLRFSQVNQEALAPENRYIGYRKYDMLDRVIEAGTYPYNWTDETEASLQALADQQQWPPATDTVQTVILYDGDGTDPNQIGHLVQTVRTNTRSIGTKTLTTTTTEIFQYNNSGQVSCKTLQVSEGSNPSTSVVVSYTYDNLGRITLISYPQASVTGVAQIYYTYDQIGRIVAIGESLENPDTYAAYTYDAVGNRIAVGLNNSTVRRYASFASPRWLSTALTKTAEFTDTTTHQYWTDGSIQAIATTFSSTPYSDQYTYQFSYDSIERLTSAQNSSHADWNVAITQYDANSNILSLQQNGQEETLAYTPGTNQISTIQYNPFGHVQVTSTLQLAYEPGSEQTSQTTLTTGNTIVFAYNGQGQRALKQVLDQSLAEVSSKLYVHGTNSLPILEMMQDGSAIAYIYGPDGLIAMKSDALYFIAKDHQGSIRQVFDTDGNLIAGYDYLPFGGLARSYGPQPDLMTYRYTGQEFDAETGLYNYRARFYDCALRCFYSPDPKRQFASPYIYAGNNPIMMIDPTGMASTKDIFTDIGQILVDTALTVAGVIVLGVGGPAATVFGSGLLGSGISGFTYDIHTLADHKQPSWKDWGIQLGIGAATGVVAGGFAAGAGAIVDAGAAAGYSSFEAGGAARIAVNVGLGGVIGNAGSGALGAFLNDEASHTSLSKGVGFAALLGGVLGAAGGAVSEGIASKLSQVKAPWSPEDYESFFNSTHEERMDLYSKWESTGFKRIIENTVKNNILMTLPGDFFSALNSGVGVIPTIPKW